MNNSPGTSEQKENTSMFNSIKKFFLSHRGKTVFLALVALVAVGITVNSSIQYEAKNSGDGQIDKPAPTYTGSAPLPITSVEEAFQSNNDFILVITPCNDDALNTSVTDVVVAAGNKIRSTDKIYVGVFTLPKDESLAYPTVLTRLLSAGDDPIYQYTIRRDITLDSIYDIYLSRKFFRDV
jgi:hypothetical protein